MTVASQLRPVRRSTSREVNALLRQRFTSCADAVAALQHCDYSQADAIDYLACCRELAVSAVARAATPESK